MHAGAFARAKLELLPRWKGFLVLRSPSASNPVLR